MAIKIYFRRFISLLLCGLLVFCSLPIQVYAADPVTAASLAIAGGQLAGAGLSGEAALSLAGPVGAVVGVTLGALGVNAYVSKAAQEAGKTRTRFVLDKLVIWGAQAGYTQEQLYSKIAQGISVAADGTISLARDTANMIDQFGNWLFTQEGTVVPNIGSPSTSGTITLNGLTLPYTTTFALSSGSGDTRNWYWTGDPVAYLFTVQSGAWILCAISNESGQSVVRYVDDSPLGSYSLLNHLNDYYYVSGLAGNVKNPVSSMSYNGTINSFIGSLDGTWNPDNSTTSSDDVFVGTPEDWLENKDVLNPSAEDTPIVLNPDLLNPIIDSLTDGQQATMSIIDYLEALQDAWDHALDDVQTAIGTITDTLTGIQEQIAVPQDAVKNPTVTNPSDSPETTPILDPSTVDPGTVVTGLSFDLTQIFPFCIPFDIYDMLATLSATPEAPVYHVHYEGPYNILIDFTVDLSPWDSVAAVLRTVELLAFCIGLAYVTRSMFIRS